MFQSFRINEYTITYITLTNISSSDTLSKHSKWDLVVSTHIFLKAFICMTISNMTPKCCFSLKSLITFLKIYMRHIFIFYVLPDIFMSHNIIIMFLTMKILYVNSSFVSEEIALILTYNITILTFHTKSSNVLVDYWQVRLTEASLSLTLCLIRSPSL